MGIFSKIGNAIDTALNYIWEGFVTLLKFALALGVLIIIGVFELAKGLLDYAKRAWKRVKERFPRAKAASVTNIGGKAFIAAINDLKERATIGESISFDELEEIENKFKNGEANAANVLDGIDANGNEAVLDIEFIKANGIDQQGINTRLIAKN